MKYEVLSNGDLKLTVDGEERKLLRTLYREDPDSFHSDSVMQDWFEGFIANSAFQWVEPLYAGALTSAPMIGIYSEPRPLREGEDMNVFYLAGHWDDKDWVQDVEHAFAFMDYQIRSVLEDLKDKGYAVFQTGTDKPWVDVNFMYKAEKRMNITVRTDPAKSDAMDKPIKMIGVWTDGDQCMFTACPKRSRKATTITIDARTMDEICQYWLDLRK